MSAVTGTKQKKGTAFWWFLLILSTVVSITLNLWHAWTIAADPALIADACQVSQTLCEQAKRVADRVAGVHPVLGFIFAIVPPLFAAGLSHGLKDERVVKWVKRGIIGLFVLSMATSIVSQASVMHPYGGGYLAEWAIPVVLDSSALIALYMITTLEQEAAKAAKQADIERDMEALREQLRPGIERDIQARAEQDMAARERDIEARLRRDIGGEKERDIAAVEAQAQRDIAAVREAAERDIEALRRDVSTRWKQREAEIVEEVSRAKDQEYAAREPEIRRQIEAQIRLEMPTEKRPGNRKALDVGPSGKKDKVSTEMTPEKRLELAVEILRKDPTISGAELGRKLGVSSRQGARLYNSAAKELGLTQRADGDAEPVLRAVG